METKETSYKEVLKSNIILFLSYAISLGFILVLLCFLVKTTLHDISNAFLSITLSLMAGIFIFYLLHFACRSSNFETFRKMHMKQDESEKFIKKMNLFFVICIILSILFCVGYLLIDNFMYLDAINQVKDLYSSSVSPDLANEIINYIKVDYQNSLLEKVSCNIIIELSLVISFISLISYQKKLLKKFNRL